MRNVVISTSKGKNAKIETGATTWGQFSQELRSVHGYDLSGLKAIVGGLNVTLESTEAVLPNTNFTLFLSPVKIKAGGYDLAWSVEDVNTLSYVDLRTELKSIRTQASEADDIETMEFIGNYTHSSVDELKAKLKSVYQRIGSSSIEDSSLEERVFELEYVLGIVNPTNEEKFFQRKDVERKNIEKTL